MVATAAAFTLATLRAGIVQIPAIGAARGIRGISKLRTSLTKTRQPSSVFSTRKSLRHRPS
jgi:hypothetical protein